MTFLTRTLSSGGFQPVTTSITSPGSGSIPIPAGTSRVFYAMWGDGAGGGGGQGSPNFWPGGGGGSGGHSHGELTGFTPGTSTLNYTLGSVGTGGVNGASRTDGTNGGSAVLSSGTAFVISTITCGGGVKGLATDGTIDGAPGAGGTVTNANAGAVNVPGNAGSGRNGGTGVTGVNPPDAGPYGKGGNGGGSTNTGSASNGSLGAIIIYCT